MRSSTGPPSTSWSSCGRPSPASEGLWDGAWCSIAESDLDDPRLVRAPALGGYGLDAAWADDVHHALHVSLTGERSGYYADFEPMRSLARVLRSPYLFNGGRSVYRDVLQGRSPGRLSGGRFVAALQNHDQVGNRARGERLSALVGIERLMVGAALLVAAPYVPLIFAGEEWAASTPFLYFTDHADPALAEAVRRGRRAEFAAFGWKPEEIPDPQDERTFRASRLRWDERAAAGHARVHALVARPARASALPRVAARRAA